MLFSNVILTVAMFHIFLLICESAGYQGLQILSQWFVKHKSVIRNDKANRFWNKKLGYILVGYKCHICRPLGLWFFKLHLRIRCLWCFRCRVTLAFLIHEHSGYRQTKTVTDFWCWKTKQNASFCMLSICCVLPSLIARVMHMYFRAWGI